MIPLLALTADHFVSAAMPIGILGFVISVVLLGMHFKHQRRKMWHDTVRLALEKGQPIPALPDDTHADRPRNDARVAAVLIAIGLAVCATLERDKWILGALPGFVGVALLVNALLERRRSERSTTDDARRL